MQTKTALLWALLVSWLVGGVSAQEKQPNKGETKGMSNAGNFQLLTPNSMPKSVGYSQVAKVTGGTIVFVAGQVALDKSGNVVGKGRLPSPSSTSLRKPQGSN